MAKQFGRYVVADEHADRLGEGAFGLVYRALDPKLNRPVAIKILRRETSDSETTASRFFREARALAALQHPGVVPVHDFGEEDGAFYLVLAFYAGGSLAGRLHERLRAGLGPFSAAETLALLEPICGGLTAAHQLGMIHRDLKPANILLDADGRPAISDFGLVRLIDDEHTTVLTQRGDVMGSPAYMAPEQWEPELRSVTPQTDLYALGCIVYQLLTGHPPFQGSAPVMQARHLEAPPPRPSAARPELPRAWDDAVACLMAKEPSERFGTADAFLAWLKLALADETSHPLPARVPPTATLPPEASAHSTTLSLPASAEPGTQTLGAAETLRPTRAPGPEATLLGTEPTLRTEPPAPAVPEPAVAGKPLPWLAVGAVGLAALAVAGWLAWPHAGGKQALSSTTPPAVVSPAPSASAPSGRANYSPANSLGQRFVIVPLPGGGSIEMSECEVRVQDFRAYRQAVAQGAWKGVAAPSDQPPSWNAPGFEQSDTHAVAFVSWLEADDFCRWLTAAEREAGRLPAAQVYRLPRESEWTAAVGNATHPWGNDWPPPPASGNFLIQPSWNWDDGWQSTAPVGSYKPNPLGLHDLAGNVREWCEDRFSKDQENRAVRGGSYNAGEAVELRSRFRLGLPPGHRDAYTGFRVVRAEG